MNSSIRIAAAVIRDRHDRILLVRKHGTTAFMQPGGKIHPNEDALGALARELHEELGCSIRPATARFLGRFAAPAARVRTQLSHQIRAAAMRVPARKFRASLS
jgi:8-oxo-dGTP diphosphatase